MSFIGLANNIWVDTFGGSGGGPPGGVPSWVLRADGIPATLDIDFTTGALWNGGVGNVPPWTLLAGTANNYIPPILDIDFVNDQASVLDYTNISALLTCTRASTGFYTNAGGFLTSVATNTLRVGDLGLLVEESRVNVCLQSQTLDNASWTKLNSSITADNTTAPDGTTTADKIVEDNTNNTHQNVQTITPANTTQYVFEVYLKASTRNWCALQITFGGLNIFRTFDLTNGVVGATGNTTGTITALANGWFRCSITGTTVSAAAGSAAIYVSNADSVAAYAGDGVSGIFAWGAQVEAGAFPTSYIPTTTVSVTRAVDAISFVSSALFLANALTIYGAGNYINTPSGGTDQALFGISGTDSIDVDRFSGSTHFAFRGTGIAADTGLLITTAAFKLATAFQVGDVAVAVNGSAPFTSAALTNMPTALTGAIIGAKTVGGAAPMDGLITRFALWNTRRSNASLTAVST